MSSPANAAGAMGAGAESAAVDRARREADLHDFLSKPWNAAALVESINQGLKERA